MCLLWAVLVLASTFCADVVGQGRAEECIDNLSYATGICMKLDKCNFSKKLTTNRRPQNCAFPPGSRVPTVCCPWYFEPPVYHEKEGMSCFHRKYKVRGTCLRLENCPTSKMDAKNGTRPQKCDSDGNTVCCLPEELKCHSGFDVQPQCDCLAFSRKASSAKRTTSIAKQKCREYVKYVCPDPVWTLEGNKLRGRFNDYCYRHFATWEKGFESGVGYKVLTGVAPSGGEPVATPEEYPHMALLGYGSRTDIRYKCGGSLISPTFILTAAHCGQVEWALLGALNRSVDVDFKRVIHPEYPKFHELAKVREVIQHPDYNKKLVYNDIALLRLQRPVGMNYYIRPACLHTRNQKLANDVISAGWGHTSDGSDVPSDVLIQVKLNMRPLQDCNLVTDSSKAPDGLLDSQLCAGGEGIRDTCPGDSGGPLMARKPDSDTYCMHNIIGVVSFGPLTCGTGQPAVYTNVAFFVRWIESFVWPST